MKKSYLKEVTPLSSIHELLELAKKEAGEHTAYIHKENKEEKRVNYIFSWFSICYIILFNNSGYIRNDII